MTRDRIISDLFTSRDFNSCIKKMEPKYLQDDLKAEVALILCEKPDEKIVELHNSGMLKFYTVRIILNLMQSSSSPFYKKFRNADGALSDRKPDIRDKGDDKGRHMDLWTKIENGYDKPAGLTMDQFSNDILLTNYDDSQDRAIAEIENLYWYDREILKLYAEHGTYRKVEEVTGIPFESIYKTVQKNCHLIRKKVA